MFDFTGFSCVKTTAFFQCSEYFFREIHLRPFKCRYKSSSYNLYYIHHEGLSKYELNLRFMNLSKAGAIFYFYEDNTYESLSYF